MVRKRTPEEQAEYMRNYRAAKAKEPEEGEAPNPKNAIADKGEGVYGLAWDGVIGNMSQEARDAILKGMGTTKRG
jgi:hypothetical protein